MNHSVRLDELPVDVVFPTELAERIRFESETKKLTFQGFMSKADYDRLARLSNHCGYRDALDELFAISTYEGRPGSPTKGGAGCLGVFLAFPLLAAIDFVCRATALRW